MQQWYQCPRCGAQVAFGARFCGNCQTPLNWPTQQQPPPQQPPQYQQQYQQPPQYQQQPPPQYQQQYQQQPQQPGGYQQQPEPPKKKKTNVWLMGCLGLIVLAVIIGVIAVATSSGTPATSPTSSSTITAAEQAYGLAVADQAFRMSDALSEVGDLSANPQFYNNEWINNMATQLATIRLVHDEGMALKPPSSMAEIHYQYTKGLEHYYTMTELLARGVDELDASLINQAVTEMDIATDYILEATNLMNAFKESKSK
jgi:NADH:ubiquinone oxidoreductase subunit K